MSDALSFAEIEGQHVELLPARTVLTLFTLSEHGEHGHGHGGEHGGEHGGGGLVGAVVHLLFGGGRHH
jgi:hypothetical protein